MTIVATSRPHINDRIWISLDSDIAETFPSRVESTSGNELLVAAPLVLSDEDQGPGQLVILDAPHKRQETSVLWQTTDGFARLKGRVVGLLVRDLALWVFKPQGSVEQIQRRAFTRIPEHSQALLHFFDRTVEARLLDLGEGGLRCNVDAFKVGVEHLNFYTTLEISGIPLLVPATIMRVEGQGDNTMNIAVRFTDMDSASSELIRRHVFGRQIQMKKVRVK